MLVISGALAGLLLAPSQQRPAPRRLLVPQRHAVSLMSESIVVTDGTDSFYASRGLFQLLHDHGAFDKITACSSSTADAKKMLLSRQARYSGLIDVLHFSESPLGDTMAGATTWLAVNAEEAALEGQLAQAKAAGVRRVFVHLGADGPSPTVANQEALHSALEACGAEYTVMRAGSLTAGGLGGGLKLSALDEPTCAELPKDDVFRFITEALTLPEASGRLFSLCPNLDDSQFREMRRAGCDRREEAKALLDGVISETAAVDAAAAATAAKKDSEEAKLPQQTAEEREAELKKLLEQARLDGIANAKRRQEEEEAKAAARAERLQQIKDQAPKGVEEGEEEEEGKKGDGADDKSGGEGGEGDGPEPPMALA
mmetsp:Transcript_37188/g.110643  ORF Transcript_37188/g.110643 Transcript_37188/m.110643 type:complete len:371 (-) Transcript_37188:207-1319(-)